MRLHLASQCIMHAIEFGSSTCELGPKQGDLIDDVNGYLNKSMH